MEEEQSFGFMDWLNQQVVEPLVTALPDTAVQIINGQNVVPQPVKPPQSQVVASVKTAVSTASSSPISAGVILAIAAAYFLFRK